MDMEYTARVPLAPFVRGGGLIAGLLSGSFGIPYNVSRYGVVTLCEGRIQKSLSFFRPLQEVFDAAYQAVAKASSFATMAARFVAPISRNSR